MWCWCWAEDKLSTRIKMVSPTVHCFSHDLESGDPAVQVFFFIGSKCLFVSAVRWRVCAYDVEQHAPGGGQRPEKALREERADRRQNERAAPPMSTLTLYVFTFLHPASQLIYGFVFMLLSLLHFYFMKISIKKGLWEDARENPQRHRRIGGQHGG